MSGGHFNYKNDGACYEIFDYDIDPVYGLGDERYERYLKMAKKLNPLDDVELSELVYDVFCLLHSFDWNKCGDTCDETYKADKEYFRKKWFSGKRSERLKGYVDGVLSDTREKLMEMIGEE